MGSLNLALPLTHYLVLETEWYSPLPTVFLVSAAESCKGESICSNADTSVQSLAQRILRRSFAFSWYEIKRCRPLWCIAIQLMASPSRDRSFKQCNLIYKMSNRAKCFVSALPNSSLLLNVKTPRKEVTMRAMTALYLFLASILMILTAACGNSSSHQTPHTVFYTVGGVVTNLNGSGLQLQNNGGDTLNVNANGTFTFPTALASGNAYNITISRQPSETTRACWVTNGSGTATANVISVAVSCGGQWTWMGGSNVQNQPGTYGMKGVAAPDNIPAGRTGAVGWSDTNGNLWLFGGTGFDTTGAFGMFNDLWKYSGDEWTWMSGSNVVNQAGTYGTKVVASPDNVPPGRTGAVAWTDPNGNLWLFGGFGYAGSVFNDLWMYSAGEWTWISGSNTANQIGTYGTKGIGAPDNVPGSRDSVVGWIDASGDLRIFSGEGYDSAGTLNDLNDLWNYSAGEWTWISGSNVANQPGTYGTKGVAAPDNIPGARHGSAGRSDANGNLWLFGGQGNVSSAEKDFLNELWKYSAGRWTWISGTNAYYGTYGTKGVASPDNIPGGRTGAVAWIGANGDLWLFGGDQGGALGSGSSPDFNDLWNYTGGQWIWMSGSSVRGLPGTYGTPGVAAPDNVPGGRTGAVAWTDPNGNLWLFGGFGYSSNERDYGWLNDLWKYTP